MFPHSTLNLLAFPRLVNNASGVECRLWTMEPARVFYFDDVVILPNILIMSDGRRLADDGNSSIRAMKTSSRQKTYGDFHIQHHECHGRVGSYQTLSIKKKLKIGMLSMPMVVSDWCVQSTKNHSYIVKRTMEKQKLRLLA